MKYIFALTLAVSLIGWRIFSLIPGDRDPYYLKFTAGDFQGLVIGSSRTAQGIIPSRIGPGIYNFSFNSIIAPYGPTYAQAIYAKLSPKAQGPFIIEMNPSLLALSPVRERSDVFTFPEDGGFLARMRFTRLDPNPEYVLRSWRTPFYREPEKGPVKLHDDGWLDISQTRQHEEMKRKGLMIRSYEDLFRTHILSLKRTAVLKDIINTLKARGPVFLVRMPTSPEVAAVEEKYFPEFGAFARDLSLELGVGFLDLYGAPGVVTKDGDHLTKASAEMVTDLIRTRIRSVE